MLSHSVNKNGQTLYLHLSHLDVLNALKVIKGEGNFDQKDLQKDVEIFKLKYPDSFI